MVRTDETQVAAGPIVKVEDGKVFVQDLVVDDRDVVEYLAALDDLAAAVVEALRVGVRVLRIAATSGDIEMVKRQFDAMTAAVQTNVDKLLQGAEDTLAERLTKFSSEDLKKSLDGHRDDVNKELVKLFGPESANSVQRQIDKLLEQQAKLYKQGLAAVLEQTDDPENPLAKLREELKGKAEEAVREIRGLRDKVLEIVGEAKGVAAEREKGTAKGRTYQELVFDEVDRIARIFGDSALFAANQQGEKGKTTGDIVVEVNPQETSGTQLRIVVEAKDQKNISGPAILRELDEAKENRVAVAAVAVFSSPGDVPGTVRTWRDYAGHRYVCPFRQDEGDPFALEFTYRCARVDAVRSIQPEEAKLDVAGIKEVLKRVKGKLADFQQMQSNLTGARGSIDKVSELIEAHKKAMRDDLDEVDRLFRAAQQEQPTE